MDTPISEPPFYNALFAAMQEGVTAKKLNFVHKFLRWFCQKAGAI